MAKKSIFVLAACLLLAQQGAPRAQYNTQGIPPPPGTNPSPAKMTFFVTSVGMGNGHTCNNWTGSTTGSAQLGHSDRIGNGSSWNSSNATKRCSQAALESTGGAGLVYCFAIN